MIKIGAARLPSTLLTQGKLSTTIWNQTWPLLIATVATTLIGTVDVQAAGYLGVSAQAAVGLSEQILFVFNIFVISMGVGTTAIVSRNWGGNDKSGASKCAGQSLSFSIMLGVVLALLLVLCAEWLVPLFTRDESVLLQSNCYLKIYALYLVPFSAMCISNAIFRGIGLPKLAALTVVLELIINVIGDYASVGGVWLLPKLGLLGIAGSSVVGAGAAATLAAFLLRMNLDRSTFRMLPVSVREIRRVARIGLPAAVHGIHWACSMFAIFAILQQLDRPTAALAACTIGMRINGLLFVPVMALQIGVASIVGQCLGAREFERAYRAGWSTARVAASLATILAFFEFMFAEPIAGIFTLNPDALAFCVNFLRIDALVRPCMAAGQILQGCLQGAGDTRGPMLILWFTNWLVRISLAWFMCLVMPWGPTGAWLSIAASAVVAACMIAARFAAKRWMKQAV
jgi:putative MATE family efflux protein